MRAFGAISLGCLLLLGAAQAAVTVAPVAADAADVACGFDSSGILSATEDLCCPATCTTCGGTCAAGDVAKCCNTAATPWPVCDADVAPPCVPVALPDGWSLEYGTYGANVQTCGVDCWVFVLTPPTVAGDAAAGAYIYTPDFGLVGKMCASISIQSSVSGTVFAMYATSGEPISRETELWDELDLEFTSEEPDSVWVNVFHEGDQSTSDGDPYGEYAPLGGPADNSEGIHASVYCIEWDTTADAPLATWTKDGETLQTMDLTGWEKPMQAVISYWSTACTGDDDDPCDFTGPLELTEPIKVTMTDITWVNGDPEPMAARSTYP